MSGPLKMERGSGNVFDDLGFPQAKAANLFLRSQLMSELRDIAPRLSQAREATRLGATQSRLHDLMRGRIDKFSLDALVTMLTKAGMHVEVRVRKSA